MNSKDQILNSIRQHSQVKYDRPVITPDAIQFSDKVKQFIDESKRVGGDAVLLKDGEDVNQLIANLYPDAKTIASNVANITSTMNPDLVDTPRQLNGIDLGIVEGEIGVAENGAVWIPQNVKERAFYFIVDHLIILLSKDKLVNNMHEAYKMQQFTGYGFGVFISGPSKTADIEQALVKGAHGAKGVTVILV
ncbi:MAG: lactate utilization protein [Porphyromonadaceae bacterium]|nr:lactate utilization protein [Porphyromonadaceae bacterium]